MKKLFLLLSTSVLLACCQTASKKEAYEFSEFITTEMNSTADPVSLPFSGTITIDEQQKKAIAKSYFGGTELTDMMEFDIIGQTPKDSPYRKIKSIEPNSSMWDVSFGVHKNGVLMKTKLENSTTEAIMVAFPDSQIIFTFVLK